MAPGTNATSDPPPAPDAPPPEVQRTFRGHAFYPPADALAKIPGLTAADIFPTVDTIAHLHYYTHSGNHWYVTAVERDLSRAYGWYRIGAPAGAWGTFPLSHLEGIRQGLIIVMRDLHFPPTRTGDIPEITPVAPPDRDCSRPHRSGGIDAGFCAVPPAAATRLRARGWLTVHDSQQDRRPIRRVEVSYAGRVAMTLHQHRTGSSEGSAECARGDGTAYWGGWFARAWCSCGWASGTQDGFSARAIVRGQARRHRGEQLRAVFSR